MNLKEVRNVIDDMLSKNVDINSIIYKICPKCNPNHNGSCEHCAWQGTMRVCDVGVRVWFDGSYHDDHPLQIVPRKFGDYSDLSLFELWNIQYFATEEDAQKAMNEYVKITQISSKSKRYKAYLDWEDRRRSQFLSGDKNEREHH